MRLASSTFLRFSFAIVLITWAAVASAGDILKGHFGSKSLPKQPDVTLTFNVILDSAKFPTAFAELKQALEVVILIAPPGVKLQFTKDDLSSFAIEVTDLQIPVGYPEPHHFQKNYFETLGEDVDSATFIPAMAAEFGPYAVQLYWNRIANEAIPNRLNGRLIRRFDAFTRLVTALSREIYGSVLMAQTRPDILPLTDIRHIKSDIFVKQDQALFRRAAFEAGVAALKRFDALARRAKQGEAAYQDISLALAREQRNLIAAQRALDVAMAERAAATEAPPSLRSISAARCERLFVPKPEAR